MRGAGNSVLWVPCVHVVFLLVPLESGAQKPQVRGFGGPDSIIAP